MMNWSCFAFVTTSLFPRTRKENVENNAEILLAGHTHTHTHGNVATTCVVYICANTANHETALSHRSSQLKA